MSALRLLKPLAVFVNQPEPQPYIKSIKNLDGIGTTKTDKNIITIETISDLTLKIAYNEKDYSITSSIEADYGAEFIWRKWDDVRPEEDETYLDPDEFFVSFPPSMRKHYDAWEGTYNNYFKARLWNYSDFYAPLWHSPEEEVAWYVGGFLLGWRFALDPQVTSVDYLEGGRYKLERGKEMGVTLRFLEHQALIS